MTEEHGGGVEAISRQVDWRPLRGTHLDYKVVVACRPCCSARRVVGEDAPTLEDAGSTFRSILSAR